MAFALGLILGIVLTLGIVRYVGLVAMAQALGTPIKDK